MSEVNQIKNTSVTISIELIPKFSHALIAQYNSASSRSERDHVQSLALQPKDGMDEITKERKT